MVFFRRTAIISMALGLFTVILLIRRLSPRPEDLRGQDGPLYNPEVFSPGVAKTAGQNYTRVLVMARLSSEDVGWVSRELPGLATKIYTVDAADSGLPANKGHEAMVYLTYIIDYYDALPDVVLFFHAHQKTWHNNVMLDVDSAKTIKLLSDAHVARQGYFNTRCHLNPGCPDWLHVDQVWWRHDHKYKPEEPTLTSSVFHELHGPDVPIPKAISQPCCAQFAVSGERIRQRPRADYVRYRNWLLATDLTDRMSGRMMEYSWQYIFTGNFEYCPSPHNCYCDGYGICFEGVSSLQSALETLTQKQKIDRKLKKLADKGKGTGENYKRLARDSRLLGELLTDMREHAIRRGFDPKTRAEECGREWHEGDGF